VVRPDSVGFSVYSIAQAMGWQAEGPRMPAKTKRAKPPRSRLRPSPAGNTA